jgi:hypothetical protein
VQSPHLQYSNLCAHTKGPAVCINHLCALRRFSRHFVIKGVSKTRQRDLYERSLRVSVHGYTDCGAKVLTATQRQGAYDCQMHPSHYNLMVGIRPNHWKFCRSLCRAVDVAPLAQHFASRQPPGCPFRASLSTYAHPRCVIAPSPQGTPHSPDVYFRQLSRASPWTRS